MQDKIHPLAGFLAVIEVSDISLEKFKIGMMQKWSDIFLLARSEVIQAADLVAVFEQEFAQVGADKTGAPGNEYAKVRLKLKVHLGVHADLEMQRSVKALECHMIIM